MRRSIPAARIFHRLVLLAAVVTFIATLPAPAQTVGVPPVFASRLQTETPSLRAEGMAYLAALDDAPVAYGPPAADDAAREAALARTRETLQGLARAD